MFKTPGQQLPNVYFLSGLGADKRIFKRLSLPGFSIIYIDWIAPLDNESLGHYAARLSKCIDTSQPFQLVGLSFGGMIAVELAKLLQPMQTIIISSASTSKEIPWHYKIAGSLRLISLMPIRFLKISTLFTYWIFGAKTAEEKKLLKQIIKDTDNQFLKWALRKIITWKNVERPHNLFHIHGTSDKFLPIKNTNPDYVIKNGQHLMIYSQAEILSKILSEKLVGR